MRTLIVGGVGSGKTTLAKYLSEFFDIPFFSIDSIIYDENNKKRDEDSQKKIANKINRENKEFIIDIKQNKSIILVISLLKVKKKSKTQLKNNVSLLLRKSMKLQKKLL